MNKPAYLRNKTFIRKKVKNYYYYTEHIHFPPVPQVLVEPDLLYDCVYCLEAPNVFTEIAKREEISLGPKYKTKEDYEDARRGLYTLKRYIAPTEQEIEIWLRQNLGENYDNF